MAYIAHVEFTFSPSGDSGSVRLPGERTIRRMPVLFSAAGRPWEQAAAYLATAAVNVLLGRSSLAYVESQAWHLHSYLAFCEQSGCEPLVFGRHRYDKPTYLYHGYLRRRIKGEGGLPRLSAETAAARMNTVVRFIRWLQERSYVDPTVRAFIAKNSAFEPRRGRANRVYPTDLTIPRRIARGPTVEGGLRPVSPEDRDLIIVEAQKHASRELALMLELGFRSGLRLESICGMTVAAMANARSYSRGTLTIPVGPKAGVPTKRDVNYGALVPESVFERLTEYVRSTRRAIRVAKAPPGTHDLVFLTRWGEPYAAADKSASTSVSKQMSRFRGAVANRLDLSSFYFHCTRATFGVAFVYDCIARGIPENAILVELARALGHTSVASTLPYLSYVRSVRVEELVDARSRETAGS